jgi:hypothetical protein
VPAAPLVHIQPTSLALAAAAAAREEEAVRHTREAFEIHDLNSQIFFPDTGPPPPGYTAIRDFGKSSRRWGAVTGCTIFEIDLPRNPDAALRRVFT